MPNRQVAHADEFSEECHCEPRLFPLGLNVADHRLAAFRDMNVLHSDELRAAIS